MASSHTLMGAKSHVIVSESSEVTVLFRELMETACVYKKRQRNTRGGVVAEEDADRDEVGFREVRGQRHALGLPVRVVREVRQLEDGLRVRRR